MQGNLPVRFGERDGRIQARQQAHGAPVPTLRWALKSRQAQAHAHGRAELALAGRRDDPDRPTARATRQPRMTSRLFATISCGRVWANKRGNAFVKM